MSTFLHVARQWQRRDICRAFHSSRVFWNETPKSTLTEGALGEKKEIYHEPYDEEPLPYLSRPLGVRHRPTTSRLNTKERLKGYLDADKVMAERELLVKEASKGYFHDLNRTRRHGGKTWLAPKSLIREDQALYFPDIQGKNLKGSNQHTTDLCIGRITVLAVITTRISEFHIKGFSESTNNRYLSNPLYQFVQINLQENLLKSLLVNLFANSLRSVIPLELHSTYLVSSQNMEYERDPLSMTNSRVGYVYLVDENLKIRWAGSAGATVEEAQTLEICTGVLLKRLEQSKLEPVA
ncbi:related to ATP10-F1F0 ATPase complex assembly protein [Armillaria ostoyae]|uniref:Related to ATP10-F1F0 ATPase complex assembly protein n=1 Tax=Armillaria ostoyae TaxID=47428 RepID=A0A284RRG7_ARMOS|nr:related to ATP10-F1F0 ATPase complex assembly protein [Armillaria ostoyae]